MRASMGSKSFWMELHYWFCIVCYSISGTVACRAILHRSWDMFACEAGVSMDQVKLAYYAVMICETFDGALVSFIYFVLRAFPKSQYTSLMLHHILSAVGLSYGYFAGGHPDLFAAIVSLDVLVPIWYLYRLYPSKLLYTLRGTLVAYGRLFVVLSTCALCVHHLSCMEDKVKAAVTLVFLVVFLCSVEIPMFKAATRPYRKEDNEMGSTKKSSLVRN